MSNAAKISNPFDVIDFMVAGKATLTLKSRKTGKHYTYKVSKVKEKNKNLWFVGLMTGKDNKYFSYIGYFTADGAQALQSFIHTKKSKLPVDHPGVKAFSWFLNHLRAQVIPSACEVWHEGMCGRCGRKLTVPSSIASGIGPECARKVANQGSRITCVAAQVATLFKIKEIINANHDSKKRSMDKRAS